MKKIVSTVLATVMILSLIAGIAIIPASADEGGDWVVYTAPGSYVLPGDETSDPEAPVPGYGYTSEGFVVEPYDFQGANTPRFNVMTKEQQYLKDGISLKVRVDNYVATNDNWCSFSIWSDSNVQQGDNTSKYGEGFTDLIRFQTDRFGAISCYAIQSFINDLDYYNPVIAPNGSSEATGTPFCFVDNVVDLTTATSLTVDEEGRIFLDLNLVYNADEVIKNENDEEIGRGKYHLYICGTEVRNDVIDDYIKSEFPDGYAYIGFSINNSKNGLAGCTITEYNGQVPTGTDSAEPIVYERIFGEMIDSSTVPEGEPAILLEGLNAKDQFKPSAATGLHFGGNFLDFTIVGNRIHGIADATGVKTIAAGPRDEISYEASDFPYFAVLFRNFCACVLDEGDSCYDKVDENFDYIYEDTPGEAFTLWYCAGETLKPDDDHKKAESVSWMGTWTGNDGGEYKLYIFDLTDSDLGWEGRINMFQLSFDQYQIANDTQRQFDLCYMGCFRTEDDAEAYALDYAANAVADDVPGGDVSDTESDPVEVPSDTESTPVEVPSETESTPVEVPSETESDPVEVPSETESDPVEVPSETESDPVEVPSETESTPVEVPSDTESTPETNPPAESKPATNNGGADNKDDEGGCGSVAGISAIAIALTAVAAGALCLKKKED